MRETDAEVRRKQSEQAARRSRARPGVGGRGWSLALAVAALLVLVAVFNISVITVYHSSSSSKVMAQRASVPAFWSAGKEGSFPPRELSADGRLGGKRAFPFVLSDA